MTPDQIERLQEIFGQTIERPPADRKAFIDRAAAGDEALRAELYGLVASYRDGDTFLEPSLFDGSGPLQPGQILGPYRIEREIDRGGMGVVYLARDTRLDRDVAVKAMAPHLLADATQRERFRREALAAASISHRAVATIHSLEDLDGHCYIVSEYVPGQTLAEEIGDGRLGPETAVEIALQVAEGLDAAHRKGVVHRDLKPANIVRDLGGQPKVLDFGMALIPQSAPDQRLTRAGQPLGSPAYMSPEQLRCEPLDFRTDMFSFGILLYELIEGRHPFEETTVAGTITRILENEPPGLTGPGAALPALNRVIQRCLQKNPAERYPTTAALVDDLRALRRESPLSMRTSGATRGRTRAGLSGYWWAFHQAAVVLLYLVMALSLLGIRSEGPLAVAAYFAIVTCATANGILRVHLLFTSRFNRAALGAELVRATPWIRRVDGLFSAFLAAAALTLYSRLELLASLLLAVAIGYLVVFLFVEPATVKAVFPDRDSNLR